MTVLVSDSFNRADNTTTLGTTDSYNGGTATSWQYRSGSVFGIMTNRAYCASGTNPTIAYVDSGQSDVTITVTATQAASSDYYAAMFRYDPITNTGLLVHTNPIKIQSFSNSTYTNIATTSISTVANDVFKIVLSGSSITVYRNGTQILTATSTINQTKTNHGIGSWRGVTSGGGGGWDNFEIDDLNTGGTNASITSVIANTNASALSPTVSTSSSVSANITGTVASAQADGLSPQVGSFTNVSVNAISANATANAINPSVSTTRNINLGAPIPNAVSSAFVPNVGLSQSATISAVIASLVVDGIAPSIATTQGTNINSVVAGSTAGTFIPVIQTDRDMTVSAVVAGANAFMFIPSYVTGVPAVVVDTVTYGKSNKVTIDIISRKVDVQPFFNKVDVEVIRVHTDYYFMTYSQTTSVDKEV